MFIHIKIYVNVNNDAVTLFIRSVISMCDTHLSVCLHVPNLKCIHITCGDHAGVRGISIQQNKLALKLSLAISLLARTWCDFIFGIWWQFEEYCYDLYNEKLSSSILQHIQLKCHQLFECLLASRIVCEFFFLIFITSCWRHRKFQ